MQDQKALRAKDCARMFGVALRTWRNWGDAGLIPRPRRIGGAVLWDRDELASWFADGCKVATRPTFEGRGTM